jgi:L-alanine-DL-glutamate epimerase-like enolase superfamily enzyme
MILKSLDASELAIPFKGAFKHASAERHAMQSLWVRVRAENGELGFGEGCPREYVTAENMSGALAFVNRHRAEWLSSLQDLQALKEWVSTHRSEIDAHPAAWTAVELALLDLYGKNQRCSVERLIQVPELAGRFQYTAILGDGPSQQFAAQIQQFLRAGFVTYKIKLSPDMRENEIKARLLTDAGIMGEAVRADANNLWRDSEACVRDLGRLRYRFTAVEEPLQPGDFAGLDTVAQSLNTRIILDESVSRLEQLDGVPSHSGRWIVNCRVSKMGGLLRSLHLLQSACSRDLAIIVGAHVGETSVLTRAALALASASGSSLMAQEGAFGTHLLTRDVASPPLMFGAGGVINIGTSGLAGRPGFGLNISPDVTM